MAGNETIERIRTTLQDRYEIERELGRGGMATVYLGRDVKHDREVAIKVLHPELAASIGTERFEREIRLAAKLQHPHILGLYDSGSADGLLYYVMPFVKGESLRDRLDRESQLPIEETVQLILEVSDALGHAHAQGIVHRDIKPENILLSNGHALVADFGIAKAATEGAGAKLTQTGMALGTPVYMAPEQAMGEVVGPTADIYSMGCMLYEMLAGEPPFTGRSAHAIMARHAMETVPSIRIIRNAVPEEVEEAILAAMAKNPPDRPQSAAKFAEILGVPLGATATRRVAMRHTATRRVPTGMTQSYSVPEGAPPVPFWRRPLVIGAAALVLLGGGIGAWFAFARKGAPPVAAAGAKADRIAILFFDDLSSDKSLGFLADGLTESLINALTRVQGLYVVSRGGVAPFRGANVPIDSIARSLDVGTIIQGSVERSGDNVRVNVKLLDPSGSDIARDNVQHPAADLVAVRDSLASTVADLVRSRIGREVRIQAQRQTTRNTQAWSLVQQAEVFRHRAETAEDSSVRSSNFEAADSLLALAEKADGKWSTPPAQRALVAYRRSRVAAIDPLALKGWIRTGREHVERALGIDPNDPDALEVRGNLRYWSYLLALEPDAAKARDTLLAAKADLEQATTLNPAQAGAFATLSHLYYSVGTGLDVNLAAQRAWEADAFLDNASQILERLFTSSYDLEEPVKARRWCDETRRRFPASFNAPNCELYLLTMRGETPDVDRAWRLADSVTALAAGPRQELVKLSAHMMTAVVIARAGLADSAAAVIERSKGDKTIDGTSDLYLLGAFGYVTMGRKAQAIEMLKVYFAANERARAGYANPGWQFRDLANDPEYQRLTRG